MKNLVSSIVLLLLTTLTYAQNKSLGVGTVTPSSNAALHVESPTNNQGAILPRLTTAQRTAMTGILTTADVGMLLYDTDLKTLFSWNGSAWKSPGASSLLPLTDTLSNSDMLTDFDALKIMYTGDSSRTLLNLHFANASNPNVSNPFRLTHDGQGAAFLLNQTSTLGTGAIFTLNNPANPQQAFRALTMGTGQAGNFRINNASSTATGLYAETNGSGPALMARNRGTGNGFAGLFRNDSITNTFPAIQASTRGPGTGVRVIQDASSTGGGIDIYMNNPSSTAVGLNIDQQGLDASANFNISNATNGVSTINANTSGTGSAGFFSVNNAASSATGLHATTSGTGSAMQGITSTGFTAVYGRREGASNGNAGMFEITDAGNTYPALQVNTVGTGGAGNFIVNNATNTSPALNVQTNSTNGFGIRSFSTGNEVVGYFETNNPTASSSTLFGLTNSTNGSAIGAVNTANATAFAIWQGGMRVSTSTLSGGGNINTRAVAYTIDANSYTINFTLNEGDIFHFFNTDGATPATVNGITIPDSSTGGVTLIYIGGALRQF